MRHFIRRSHLKKPGNWRNGWISVIHPKHGSWLNIAEIELNVMTRQCLKRRIPDITRLSEELTAWEQARNKAKGTVDWQFTTADARINLKSLYPNVTLL